MNSKIIFNAKIIQKRFFFLELTRLKKKRGGNCHFNLGYQKG